MRWGAILLTALLAVGLNGCWFARKATVAAPPPAPQPTLAKPAPAPPPEAKKEEPLTITEPPPALPPTVLKAAPLPVGEPPSPPKKRAAKPKKKPVPAEPEAAPAVVSQAPPTRLEAVLPDGRRREYETDFTRSVTEARAALDQAGARTLTSEQKQTVERIQTFLQQAEQAKSGDLATALQLARRANLLAQDLRKSLQ
jgi:hypothetical protein